MQEFLHHPAVQGGLAPFLAALIVAELLQRLRLSGLAIAAGFATTVYLVSGFTLEPLTASRKIVLLGLTATVLAPLLALFNPGWLRPLLATAAAVATIWMAKSILLHQDLPFMLLWSAGCALYVAWLIYWMDELQDAPVRAASAGLALGLGTGAAALFGATALLGLYGLSLGAAAGAYLLLLTLTSHSLPCGRNFTLPLALVAGLIGCLAVLTARLPWYVLPVLAIIPIAAKIPVSEKPGLWLQSVLLSIITLTCAVVAVFLTWRVTGAVPF